MNSSLKAAVEIFIEEQTLPQEYLQTVERWFLPIAEQLLHKVASSTEPLVIGVSGCQGSGKSTLASLLVILFKELIGLKAVNLSIDDFYLTHKEREQLGSTVHPLLATRGVPGTHDVSLAVSTLNALKNNTRVAIPRFNKAVDDRFPQDQWPVVQGPVDIIILEGWCLCIEAEPVEALSNPLNELERTEDADGRWRSYVNKQIEQEYAALYAMVDYLLMLKAPNFDKVFEWRQTQENKLASAQSEGEQSRIMSETELVRFIQHYERITRHGLLTLEKRADVVFQLTESQTIERRL